MRRSPSVTQVQPHRIDTVLRRPIVAVSYFVAGNVCKVFGNEENAPGCTMGMELFFREHTESHAEASVEDKVQATLDRLPALDHALTCLAGPTSGQ